ncbi:MAG TPA: bifunctional oligoribonuclease/PAP phosphatase NrnA [Clostridiales bacterium]|nr:bifunctional oligoribonuclease/PAP phosphatase NrnA [Clostridiales bacterium]HQP69667.1 bifunctional oligoribonuclease/PAP phosphatase NrnA [Clostridiales bacterium]
MDTKNVISLIGRFLKENNDFLIAAHHAPDGDNIGASIGMYLALKNSGKQAVIVNDDKIVERYVFLLGGDKGAFVQYSDELKNKKYKNIIILDTATSERVGKVRNIIADDALIINIDHHPTNEMFGTLNYVDSSSASASQLVYRVLKENGFSITKQISDALLSGVLSDTGGLRFENTDSKVLSSVQEFIACGSDLTDITDRIFLRLDYEETIKVSEIASKIELFRNERIALAYNDQTVNPLYENEPVLMILNSISEAGVSLFVRKNGEDFYKISIRSKGGFNVSDFAAKWNGGGHKNAAGIKFYGSFDKLRNTLLKDLREDCLKYYGK